MNSLFILLCLLSVLCFIIGLVQPSIFRIGSRSKTALIFGAAVIVFFVFTGITASSSSEKQAQVSATSTTETSIQQQSSQLVTTPAPKAIPQKTAAPQQTQQSIAPAVTTATQATQTNTQNTAPISNETVSQKNAVEKAKSYLSFSAFSHDGLVAQLEYDQFSDTDAIYGADNSGADWNEQAAAKAKSYMSYSAFSRGGLIQQLEYDKFTQAQAEYGANAVGL